MSTLAESQTYLRNALTSVKSGEKVSDGGKLDAREIDAAIVRVARELPLREVAGLLDEQAPLLSQLSKAKAAKIVRTVIEESTTPERLAAPGALADALALVEAAVALATAQKRTFLRQRLQAKLAELQLACGHGAAALTTVTALTKEVKALDDKLLLVETQLTESKVHLQLKNLPKSKASLTNARAAANSVYCPPMLQGQIDVQSGILNGDEGDWNTAYSYFFEAFESYAMLGAAEAPRALKLTLLSKIMLGKPSDVKLLLASKAALKYADDDTAALRKLALSVSKASLTSFEQERSSLPASLADDPVVSRHLQALYGQLVEANIQRVIEPYSRVEVAHIASLVGLPTDVIERRLSQMILENKVSGVLDQAAGLLEVFDDAPTDETYPLALEVIGQMGKVVDRLTDQAKVL
jgi:26S proteasome regulatory subunit N6